MTSTSGYEKPWPAPRPRNNPMTPMFTKSAPSMSLYKIDLELLALLQAREDLQSDTEMTAQEIEASVNALDSQIANYLPQALANRADEVANIIRQFEAMDEVDAKEMARVRERRQLRIQAREYLERRVLDLMTRADQKRIDGQHVTLFRKKTPASVDVVQPDLVPDPYKRVAVTLTLDLWSRLLSHLMPTEKGAPLFGELMECKASAPEPMLSRIKAELQQPCPECSGQGKLPMIKFQTNLADAVLVCPGCGGSGKNSVPGCRLANENYRLEIK